MGKEAKEEQKEGGKVRIILINIIRVILVLTLIFGIYDKGHLIISVSIFSLILTFVPYIIENYFNIKLPAMYEVLILLFVYGVLVAVDVNGLYGGFWILGLLLRAVAAVALGFVGFSVLYVLYKEKKLNANIFLISLLTFCFAVAVGTVWEILEFGLDHVFGFHLQENSDTIGDLLATSLGALFVSLAGYYYMKNGRVNIVSGLVERYMEKNAKAFKNVDDADKVKRVREMINNGEGHELEFKSSLRTNLHTKEVDKKVEHAALKTITAYLNSNGGTLLIGVGDKGEILGMENDSFSDKDKVNLHFTNLIKNHVGPEYLPYIKFELVNLDGKDVLKVECEKSGKHVFLRHEGEEEFYVRNGPSSVKLNGNALVDYIHNNFGIR